MTADEDGPAGRREQPRGEQGPDGASSPDWVHRAIIYGVDVLRFADSNGDGDGDLRGLVGKLGYLADLGVDCLWLLPFFPSERRDNGYDITNQLGVDPRIGSLDDFRLLAEEAHARGIRLLVDLVLHHTSNRHPWFQAGESDAGSRFRGYYLWSAKEPPDSDAKSAFPQEEHDGIWSWSERARAFYRHKFYDFELQWTPEQRDGPRSPDAEAPPEGPTIFAALREQLGLRLESKKGLVEVYVIDHAEKPSGN